MDGEEQIGPLDTLMANAWTGAAAPASPVVADYEAWVRGARDSVRSFPGSFAPPSIDPNDWRDPAVGWGVVLPWREGLDAAALRAGDDAPEPIRQLIADRGGVVLRYRAASTERLDKLWDADGRARNLAATTAPDRGGIPRFLLIYGPPAAIPWRLQYVLQARPDTYVGRLDLEGEALEHYVGALRSGWKGARARPGSPVIWAVDHGAGDITRLMREVIAERVRQNYAADSDLAPGLTYIDGDGATGAALAVALGASRPALVVTTSHGMTGPLDRPAQMAADLGLPVDRDHAPLDLGRLLAAWQPDGAVWYAHACCSAGGDDRSMFSELFPAGASMRAMLEAVAALGATTAPLPRALLGAKRPLRAFIGHVEPTFDWTLRQPGATATRTEPITDHTLYRWLFYDRAYLARFEHPPTVGRALSAWLRELGIINTLHSQGELLALGAGATDEDRERQRRKLLYYQLVARDVEATVLLGDPTVALPELRPPRAGRRGSRGSP